MWDLYDTTGRVRAGITSDVEARNLVIVNASPEVYVVNTVTGVTVTWADVEGEEVQEQGD